MIYTLFFYLRERRGKLFLSDLPVEIDGDDFRYEAKCMQECIHRILDVVKEKKKFSLLATLEDYPKITVEVKFPTDTYGDLYDSYKIGMTIRNMISTIIPFLQKQ